MFNFQWISAVVNLNEAHFGKNWWKNIPSLRNKAEMTSNIRSVGDLQVLSILLNTEQRFTIALVSGLSSSSLLHNLLAPVIESFRSIWTLIKSFKTSATASEGLPSATRYPAKLPNNKSKLLKDELNDPKKIDKTLLQYKFHI